MIFDLFHITSVLIETLLQKKTHSDHQWRL